MKALGFRVNFDSKSSNEFHVEKLNGTTRVFHQSSHGLYYMDTEATGISLVNTVAADDQSNFTKNDYSLAILACQIKKMIGLPSNKRSLNIVDNSLLKNCSVTCCDIEIADAVKFELAAKHCQLKFGTYVQTYEEHNNYMAPCTPSAIALQTMGDERDGY